MDCMMNFKKLTLEQKRALLLPDSVEELVALAKLCGIEMTIERAEKLYRMCHSSKTSIA